MNQKPSVGRIVHYVSYGTPGGEYQSECRAAIITAAHGDEYLDHGDGLKQLVTHHVALAVLNPEGMYFNQMVSHYEGDDKPGGTWHWPERVD